MSKVYQKYEVKGVKIKVTMAPQFISNAGCIAVVVKCGANILVSSSTANKVAYQTPDQLYLLNYAGQA